MLAHGIWQLAATLQLMITRVHQCNLYKMLQNVNQQEKKLLIFEKKGNTQKQFSVLDRGTFKIAFFPFFQLIYFLHFGRAHLCCTANIVHVWIEVNWFQGYCNEIWLHARIFFLSLFRFLFTFCKDKHEKHFPSFGSKNEEMCGIWCRVG